MNKIEVSEEKSNMISMFNKVSGNFTEKPVFMKSRQIRFYMDIDETRFPVTNTDSSTNTSSFINSVRRNRNIRKNIIVYNCRIVRIVCISGGLLLI